MNNDSPVTDPLMDALIATNVMRGKGKYSNNCFPYTQPLPSSHYLLKTGKNIILSVEGVAFSYPYIKGTCHTTR